MIWLLLATIIWFAGRSFGGYTEETRHEYYLNLSMHYNDPNRKITMQNILKDASGIYVNSDKSRHDDIKKSVLMISIVSDEGRLGDPKLLNFLCYAKRFGLKVLVSILGAKNIDDSEFEQLVNYYSKICISLIQYSIDEKLWRLCIKFPHGVILFPSCWKE